MKDLIKKTDKELLSDLQTKQEALRVFRFNITGGKVKNMKEGRAIRKSIAQVSTVLSSRKA